MNFSIELVDWSTQQKPLIDIRTRVFVDEQHVSLADELDGVDELEGTRHFLGLLNGKAIANARLEACGKLGRLCVLPEYRRQGYGQAVLQAALLHALEVNLQENIYLHAQLEALNLYQKFGFKSCSETFMEAGIAHKKMRLQLDSYPMLAQLYQDKVLRLADAKQFTRHIYQLTQCASRCIDIFSQSLPSLIYNSEFAKALSQFARAHRYSQVRILLTDSQNLGSGNPVVTLAQRLPSSISLRVLNKEIDATNFGFTCADKQGLVFFNNEEALDGFVNYQARAESAQQLITFDYWWHSHSESDPNLAHLAL